MEVGKKNGGKWLWNFEHEEKMQYERHHLSKGNYIVINDYPNQRA